MNHAGKEFEKIEKADQSNREIIKEWYKSAIDLYERAIDQNPRPEIAFDAKIG